MLKPLPLIACIIAFLIGTTALAESKQKQYEAAARVASEKTDIFASSPLRINGSFHIFSLQGKTDGKYQYLQASKEEDREGLEAPGFNELTLRKSGARYTRRSDELEPLPFWYLRELIYSAHLIPRVAPISKITDRTENGQALKCFAIERGFWHENSDYQFCFNAATGVLTRFQFSFNSDVHRFEYSEFREQKDKLYPTKMQRFYNDKLLVEVDIDSIDNSEINPKIFEPPVNAIRQDACKKFEPAQPEYDLKYFNIRSDFKSGSVIIAGALDEQGRVQRTEIQQSGGTKLDDASEMALKQVHIAPAQCDGHRVASLFRLHIWFSPWLHPDDFQSFPK